MKTYELTVLFHPDLEMGLEPAIKKVKEIIASNGGEIKDEHNDGRKRLAYAIRGQEFAVYYDFDVEIATEAVGKISLTLNITDEVLRYLFVVKEKPQAAEKPTRKEE